MDLIVLSINSGETTLIVLCTLSQNASYDSWVIPPSSASLASFLDTILKMFSIALQSGNLGGTHRSSAWQRAIASWAILLFWEGSPSCSQSRVNPFRIEQTWCQNEAKYSAFIFLYLSHISTPLLWDIILATFPPVPTLLPFTKHPCLRPSDFSSTLFLWERGLDQEGSICKRMTLRLSKMLFYLSINSEGSSSGSCWRIPLVCVYQLLSIVPFFALASRNIHFC